MQLLKITTTPIEYKLEVEHASLKAAEQQPGTAPAQADVVSPKAQAPRARTDSGFSRLHAEGRAAPDTGVRNYHPVHGKTTAGTIAPVNEAEAAFSTAEPVAPVASAGLDAAIAQIPSGVVDRSWEPKQGMMEEATPLADTKKQMEYHPGDVSINIEKMPEVDIEYIGEPQYFPRSADPDYKPEE